MWINDLPWVQKGTIWHICCNDSFLCLWAITFLWSIEIGTGLLTAEEWIWISRSCKFSLSSNLHIPLLRCDLWGAFNLDQLALHCRVLRGVSLHIAFFTLGVRSESSCWQKYFLRAETLKYSKGYGYYSLRNTWYSLRYHLRLFPIVRLLPTCKLAKLVFSSWWNRTGICHDKWYGRRRCSEVVSVCTTIVEHVCCFMLLEKKDRIGLI